MLNKKKNIIKKAAMLMAMAALMGMASSCGQSSAPKSSNSYPAGSYEVPWGLALNKDDSQLYSANYLKNNITVYDASTMNIAYKIPTLCNPLYLAFNSDHTRLFVTHEKLDQCDKSQISNALIGGTYISVIDVATKKVAKEIQIPESYGASGLRDIVFDKNNNVFYALGSNNGKIVIVDAGQEKAVNYISYDTAVFKPIRIRLDSAANLMYIVDIAGGSIVMQTPTDPKNLVFKKLGYDKYRDGYCANTLRPENCPCAKKEDCASELCKTSAVLPYCEGMACAPTAVEGGSCIESRDSDTVCKSVVTQNACVAVVQSNSCKAPVPTTTDCGGTNPPTICETTYESTSTCNAITKKCDRNYYATTTACAADATCKTAFENTSVCNMATGKCARLFISDAACSSGFLCNSQNSTCEKTTYVDSACSSGYSCVAGVCEKTTYEDSLCDAAKGETCNSSTGKCKTSIYKDSLCASGFSCDRADGKCKTNTYPNGCECDYDSQCNGYAEGTSFCSSEGKCLTYSSLKMSVGGFCDMRYNECYTGEDVKDHDPQFYATFSGNLTCNSPSDILPLPDQTAYVTCYGGVTSSDTGRDPIFRVPVNSDGIAFDTNKTLATFNSVKVCDKPMKMALDKTGATALVVCEGSNKVYAIDVETGEVFKGYDTPDHPMDIIVSHKDSDNYFYVSGSTSDNIMKYPIPFY